MSKCSICHRDKNLLDFPFFLRGVERKGTGVNRDDFGGMSWGVTERLVTTSKPYLCLDCIKIGLRKSAYTWLKKMGVFMIGVAILMLITSVGYIVTEGFTMLVILFLLPAIFCSFFVYFQMKRYLKLTDSSTGIIEVKRYLKKKTDILYSFFEYFVKSRVLAKYREEYSNITDVFTSYDTLSILTLCDDCEFGSEKEKDGIKERCAYNRKEQGRCLRFKRLEFLNFIKFW